MKILIVYPIPFDAWHTFSPFVERFATSFKQFNPGTDYELSVVCNWGEPTDYVRQLFYGIKAKFVPYYSHGCDIGSAQHVCDTPHHDFIICMTSRCYFHREGWLKRYEEARNARGPGLYGASASWEGGVPHICTRAYAMDTADLARYPYRIDTREKGQKFEVGEWCITKWFRDQNMGCWQITWDGEQEQHDWRMPENIFRKGDQTNCIVWDKHTDAWRDADEAEKIRLTNIADKGVDSIAN